MIERTIVEVRAFCATIFIPMLLIMLASHAGRPHRTALTLMMGAVAAAAAATVVAASRRRGSSAKPPTPKDRATCPKPKTWWWPWTSRCTFQDAHDGPCSFDVIRSRMAANLALLRADTSTETRAHYGTVYECHHCKSNRPKLVRYADDVTVSHAGERFPTRRPVFAGYACLRCSEVSTESEPFQTAGSIAWYLAQAPAPAPLPRETLLRAIQQVESELERLRKLLPDPEPYR